MRVNFFDKLRLNTYLLLWQLRLYFFCFVCFMGFIGPVWLFLVFLLAFVLYDFALRRFTCSHFFLE